MKKQQQHIIKEVEDTFKVLDSIEKVQVNHFFKHKVLQKIQMEKEVKLPVFSWLTPQLQFATLGLVLLLNATAIFYAYSSGKVTITETTIDTFAQEYSLQSSSSSILN